MREIKFRAWEPKSKRMYNQALVGSPTNPAVYDNGWLECTEKAVIMQYTGLKDKNGKEIYEGDIVKGDYGPNNLGVVEYFTDGWKEQRIVGCFTVSHIVFDGYSESDMCGDRDLLESPKWSGKGTVLCEVIGNIYENPELLKL